MTFVAIDSYTLPRRDRYNRKGGGLWAYVRSRIKCEFILDFPSNQTSTKEILWFELQSSQQTYVVACCYHPSKPVYKPSEFSNELAIGLDYVLLTYPSAI